MTKTQKKEYDRRIRNCTTAIISAGKDVAVYAGVTGEYQGCEASIQTKAPCAAKVCIIMKTGHGPSFPKHVTLSVHGTIWKSVNNYVNIGGGSIASSEKKFLPSHISRAWLRVAMATCAVELQDICTLENMERLEKEALAARRQFLKTCADWERSQPIYYHPLHGVERTSRGG